jgi:hypothetical protein
MKIKLLIAMNLMREPAAVKYRRVRALHCNMRRWHAARTISAKKFLLGQWREEITEAGGQSG